MNIILLKETVTHNIKELNRVDVDTTIPNAGYVDISSEDVKKNISSYIEKEKTSENINYDKKYGIISQYGGNNEVPSSYDRYVPFKLHPEANFIIITWPLGLIQVSCNPFKKGSSIKNINLGEITNDVINHFKSELENKIITIDKLKLFVEKNKQFNGIPKNFDYNNMVDLLDGNEDYIYGLNTTPKGSSPNYTVDRWKNAIKMVMEKPYTSLSDKEIKALKKLSINGLDVVKINSGGYKCITNINLTYLSDDYSDLLTKFKELFIIKLKEKIQPLK